VTLTTDDTQASLDFGPDGIAPAGNLHATITPVDPASLAAVGPDATAVGNAYRVEVTVDGTAVVTLAKPKTLRLRQPISGATTIYESADGKAWQKLQTSVVAGHAIASTQHIGYYVIAGPTAFVPALPPPRAAHRSQGGRNLAIVVIGSLGILLAAAWDALRRRRARAHRSRAARRQAARRARSR
jgi:hypothetical protein